MLVHTLVILKAIKGTTGFKTEMGLIILRGLILLRTITEVVMGLSIIQGLITMGIDRDGETTLIVFLLGIGLLGMVILPSKQVR